MSERSLLPTTASFEPAKVEQYVRDRIYLKNPVTWLGWVSGLLVAGGGFAVFQLVELWMILAACGGVTVSLGSFVRDHLRRDSIKLDYLGELNKQLEQQADQLADWLDSQFSELGHAKAKELLERLQRHMTAFEEVLGQKFPPGTKTYEHFHGPAAALYTQALNLLKDVATQIRVNQSTDIEGARSDQDEARIALYEGGETRLTGLLEQASQAIVGLAALKQDVAEIRSGDADDFDGFLARVTRLAKQADLYIDERTI